MAATVIALATHRVSVLRAGEGTSTYGDPVATLATVATGVPMSILEQRRVFPPAGSDNPQIVTTITGRCSIDADVRVDDRLRDERTGEIYVVDATSKGKTAVMWRDQRLELRQVS